MKLLMYIPVVKGYHVAPGGSEEGLRESGLTCSYTCYDGLPCAPGGRQGESRLTYWRTCYEGPIMWPLERVEKGM